MRTLAARLTVLSIALLCVPALVRSQEAPLSAASASAAFPASAHRFAVGPLKAQGLAPNEPMPGPNPGRLPHLEGEADPTEFLFFFRHLATLDAAANRAETEGDPDAPSWRSYDQRTSGLSEGDGEVLKAVAYACNQSIREQQEAAAQDPDGEDPSILSPLEVVAAALEDLHAQLGDFAFQILIDYVHLNFGPDIEISGGPAPPTDSALGGFAPLIVPDTNGPSMGALTRVSKLPNRKLLAECDTTFLDSYTPRYYPSPLTDQCRIWRDGLLLGNVPCQGPEPGQCQGNTYTAAPGQTIFVNARHGINLFPTTCGATPNTYAGVADPLHYCYPNTVTSDQLPHFVGEGTIVPTGSGSVCWQSDDPTCLLAYGMSRQVSFLQVTPADVTVYSKQKQTFTPNLPLSSVFWQYSGPGTIANNLYQAPDTIAAPSDETLRACDAQSPDDCFPITLHLRPRKLVVTSSGEELLPSQADMIKAAITPNTGIEKVTWTVTTPGGDPIGTFPGAAPQTPTVPPFGPDLSYVAPASAQMPGTEMITFQACVKFTGLVEELCGTKVIRVPKVQVVALASANTLEGGDTVQLTAVVTETFLARPVTWSTPAEGTLTVRSPIILPTDTLTASYRSASPASASGVDITVCLTTPNPEGPKYCNSPPLHLTILNDLLLIDVQADWNAGQATPFVITGRGFVKPTVNIPGLDAKVITSTDSRIDGKVTIPVAMGGKYINGSVTVDHGGGVFKTAPFGPFPVDIVNLTILGSDDPLEPAEHRLFTAQCNTAALAACTSGENPTWKASTGDIDPTGHYKAPTAVPAATNVTITACWAGNVCAAPKVIPLHASPSTVAVEVKPDTATVLANQTKQFTARVLGTTNTNVTWSVEPSGGDAGHVDQTGLYHAPAALGTLAQVKVVAISQAEPARRDFALVTLAAAIPPLTLTCPSSPGAGSYGTPFTWIVAASGGDPQSIQYAFFRRLAGAQSPDWTPGVTAPAWQSSNTIVWTPTSGDVGTWETYIWVRDANTPANAHGYGFAAGCNPGPVTVTAPVSQPTISCTPGPNAGIVGSELTWTAGASGGTAVTRQFALFRRLAGTPDWIPALNAPEWQSSGTLTWTPGSPDVGTWETYIWVRDGDTPFSQNGYGFASGCNPGPVTITQPDAPLTLTCTPSPASASVGTTLTWTATAGGGHPASIEYAFFRRLAGTPDWIPEVGAPAWQSSNTHSWTPSAADVGTWETYVWVRDGSTPSNQNGYGFAAGFNSGPVQITGAAQLYPATGWVDGYNGQHVWGWACDPDYPAESNRVDVGVPSGPGLGSTGAFLPSSSSVNGICRGGTAHSFDFYPSGGIPSGTHFNVWSIDLPYSTPGNDNRKLGGVGAIGDGTEFVIP